MSGLFKSFCSSNYPKNHSTESCSATMLLRRLFNVGGTGAEKLVKAQRPFKGYSQYLTKSAAGRKGTLPLAFYGELEEKGALVFKDLFSVLPKIPKIYGDLKAGRGLCLWRFVGDGWGERVLGVVCDWSQGWGGGAECPGPHKTPEAQSSFGRPPIPWSSNSTEKAAPRGRPCRWRRWPRRAPRSARCLPRCSGPGAGHRLRIRPWLLRW